MGRRTFGDYWFIGHYSWRILPWFIVGTNLKLRYESEFGMGSGWGFGADLGVYFNPMDHYRYGDLGFSLNLQDMVPTQYLIVDTITETGATLGIRGWWVVTRLRAGVTVLGA